jgi:thymidine kinase
MRRFLRDSDAELTEVLQRRAALIEDERVRIPARIEAAEAFVAECERHHDVLRGR